MPAVIHLDNSFEKARIAPELGQFGPFPNSTLMRVLERRWLHYAFLSRDLNLGMVANVSWLGPTRSGFTEEIRCMSILLLYKRGQGWYSSQFNTETLLPLWSSFQQPHPFGEPGHFELKAVSGNPFVKLQMQRTSRPCTSQCAPFADNQYLRWQSETGVIARGDWGVNEDVYRNIEAVGYHERVRGYWGWPELGGWVFGFANDLQQMSGEAPSTAVVFTLIQTAVPHEAATSSVMLWQNGRLRRHFPRRKVSVAVRGIFNPDKVTQVPEMANLFGVPPMSPIPRRLVIKAAMGRDWVIFDFYSEAAARIIIPSETSLKPFSVHEVIGPCHIEGSLNDRRFEFETYGIVEFAGGSCGN